MIFMLNPRGWAVPLPLSQSIVRRTNQVKNPSKRSTIPEPAAVLFDKRAGNWAIELEGETARQFAGPTFARKSACGDAGEINSNLIAR
jgi:hypothetical protein